MVPKEEMDVTERTAYEAHYQSFRNKEYKQGKKKTAWYRLFFPLDADYNTQKNPYAENHRHNVYNPSNGYYARVGTSHFRDHMND